mmetsp:Transcript_29137/g.70230  ORF Transcript_29137/g.70230 Transcript_29137/m.70230 type:complete len:229 (+) Transcript_29137:211-897(+)|eukprot:CAMPEP_0113461846 /NCGR_PEP_ID=MMETSP0014_2-20120614/11760_1 /TAXON_ID=2857 /ORGANISM="Nitzschia sp." /LENGTH=228 /DNA_ID=CAMNT_0000353637 /DNA_START=137 /DNA_END=823 /DNA_ORIENTATION=+ /assembly_acc=CAM_ASM_000159
MKSFVSVVAAVAVAATASSGVDAFTTTSSSSVFPPSSTETPTSLFMGYVPSGFTPEQYKKFKEQEKKKKAPKQNLGGVGPKGFKSRSFQSFQEALERGETSHLLPVLNAEERVRKGELRREDIPYMQRGGSWDDSDIKGAKKKRWLSSDKEYATGGFKKEQSVSIFGKGEGLDWTGSRSRGGGPERAPESVLGAAPKFGRNYKAPNVNEFKNNGGDDNKPKKKFFGLF